MDNILEQIQQLIKDNPVHATRLIFKDSKLRAWIESNCDPQCLDNSTKVYTAITGEKLMCPCGSGKLRKYITFSKGLSFCGRANSCSAARESLSKNCINSAKKWDKEKANAKRSETNLKKYGIENIGQSLMARNAHADFYKNPENIQHSLQKMAKTNLERYGVDNASKLLEVQNKHKATMLERYGEISPVHVSEFWNKMRKTTLEKYGVSFASQDLEVKAQISLSKKNSMTLKHGRSHETQLHISEESWNILSDENKFSDMLKKYGRSEMASLLGVSVNLISVRHYAFNLDILQKMESTYEVEICNWLESMNISVEQHNRELCKPKEIDFYIPTHNLAIEFDGLYYHSEQSGKDRNYHFNKTYTCAEKGIQLIHIFEDEWIQKKEICKSIIAGYLNQPARIIAARKCIIEEISNKELRPFLNKNHLQGYATAKINAVLKFEGEIVAAMTFGKPRYSKNADWELIRLANKCNTRLIGGTQRLWEYFQKTHHPESIVSYCDRRWFTGNIYNTLGFKLTKKSRPVYWYTDYINRYHRSKFTKKNCVKTALQDSTNVLNEQELSLLSENQITRDILSLARIWDCGQDSWFWKL